MRKKEVVREVQAAGGVVVNEEQQVLLVHRPHYRDWSFPKGKVDAGESIETAAVREVREEAGLECEIVRHLVDIHYSYTTRKGDVKPKVVHYFLMKATGGELFTDGRETDEALWCSSEEARRKLSYDADRDVLSKLNE